MAKNTKKTAAKTATANAKTPATPASTEGQTYGQRMKAAKAAAVEKFGHLLFHNVTVNADVVYKGKVTLAKGTVAECDWIGASKFGKNEPQARLLVKGRDKPAYVNPAKLDKGSPMPKAKVAAMTAEREEEASKTVLVPASVPHEDDDSVVLAYTGWFKRIYFTKSMVVKRSGQMNGLDIFEVPAWRVRQECGADSLSALEAKQAEFAKHVTD